MLERVNRIVKIGAAKKNMTYRNFAQREFFLKTLSTTAVVLNHSFLVICLHPENIS